MSGEQRNKTEDFVHNRYGYCYFEISENDALIYNLYVEPEYRGKGHAKNLLMWVLNEIRKRDYYGVVKIECKPSEPDINKERLTKFYENLGLKVISREEEMKPAQTIREAKAKTETTLLTQLQQEVEMICDSFTYETGLNIYMVNIDLNPANVLGCDKRNIVTDVEITSEDI